MRVSCSWLTRSAYDLVGLEEDRRGDGEPQGFRSLEVDDPFELGGLLHREVRRFGTFEEAIHVGGCTVVEIGEVWPIGHEAAGLCMHSPGIYCQQLVL